MYSHHVSCTLINPHVSRRRVLSLPGGRAPKARETCRGSGGKLPGNILKYGVPDMPFPAFWGETLENSEAYKTS